MMDTAIHSIQSSLGLTIPYPKSGQERSGRGKRGLSTETDNEQ
jgi:hypothetical protein